jgi:hypothetical protein
LEKKFNAHGRATFLCGAAINGTIINITMLIIRRILLGINVGFANQVQFYFINIPFKMHAVIFWINMTFFSQKVSFFGVYFHVLRFSH